MSPGSNSAGSSGLTTLFSGVDVVRGVDRRRDYRRGGVVRRGRDHRGGWIETRLVRDLRGDLAEPRPSLDDLGQHPCGHARGACELRAPFARARIEHLRRARVRPLAQHRAAQAIGDVVGQHEHALRALERADRVGRVGRELVERVEGLEGDARRAVDRLVAELRAQPGERLLRARVAVGRDRAHELAVVIEQRVVDRPGVDADRVDRATLGRAAETLEDLLEEPLERPAELQTSRARGRDGRVREAMKDARLDRFIGHRHLDHATARHPEVDRDMPARTTHA